MKQIRIALVLLTLLGTAGCRKINEATEFSLKYTTTMSMPAAALPVSGTQDFVSPEIETQSAGKFSAEGTTRDLIDQISISEFKITASKDNLDFLNSVSIYIRAAGLADVLVATRSNIPAGSTQITTDVTGANIKEHVFKEKIQFRATVKFNSGVTGDKDIILDQTMLVSGKKIKS